VTGEGKRNHRVVVLAGLVIDPQQARSLHPAETFKLGAQDLVLYARQSPLPY
jgi:hypothetical protein